MTYMATSKHKYPCPEGHEIYNFGRPFFGHHDYILSLSDICMEEVKKIFKKNNAVLLRTYMVTPKHKNPCPGSHKIDNFCRPILCHHQYILSLSFLSLGVKTKIFKEIMHFHYMTYMATP